MVESDEKILSLFKEEKTKEEGIEEKPKAKKAAKTKKKDDTEV